MMNGKLWVAALLSIIANVCADAQVPKRVTLQVKESAGIRRFAYPVSARVPFARGVLKSTSNVRLLLNDMEVPAQVSPEANWPDGSIQSLVVDFNTNSAPLEQQTFRLEYGDDIALRTSPRGLTVTETEDAIQVGNVRFGKRASPLIQSVKYRQEDIGSGKNGFTVTDSSGKSHDLVLDTKTGKIQVVKAGPLSILIRYSGELSLDGNRLPFTINVEMRNGKTWTKCTASVNDPGKRIREIAFHSPLSFSEYPRLWDFGTGSWTYGFFRNATDSVVLTQVVRRSGVGDWQIKSGTKGQEQPYEVAAGPRPKIAEGWGHIQDAKEVIAFGFDDFAAQPGTYTMSLDGQGQASFIFTASERRTLHQITVYEHYVPSPVPIVAITSPVSMLHPLTVSVIANKP